MTKVMIAVVTAEYARRADFYDHIDALIKPEGTIMMRAHGQSPARNRNLIIAEALKDNCSHILFVDDDVIIPPSGLIELLIHDKDIVSGLYLMRHHPHNPIAFDKVDDDGKCKHLFLDNYKDVDLIEVVAAGLGCLLVKTDVFRKMEAPWIRLGELELDHWCDDLGFFKRAKEAGFTGWLDKTIHVGHICSMVVTPINSPEGIKIGYSTS